MEKIKRVFCSRHFPLLSLLLIILIGFFIRIYSLDKTAGMWTDELFSYFIAKEALPFGVINKTFELDIQPPLWFLILNVWMKIFGDGDYAIRILSAIFGTLAIPIIYLAGKELSDKKTGLLAASLASINSLLIYYSQEVRFYSFLTLLGALSILFILKIKNNPTYKNYAGLILSNLIILCSASIGVLFVFCEALIFAIYLFFTNKKTLRHFIYAQLTTASIFLMTILPFINVLIRKSYDFKNSVIPSFSWYQFDPVHLFIVLQQCFSPVFTLRFFHQINFKQGIFGLFSLQDPNIIFIVFTIIPIAIYFSGLITALFKKKTGSMLFLIGFVFISTEIILGINGFMPIRTRYAILAMPIFVVIASYGLITIKNKIFSYTLIGLLIAANLAFLIINPYSTPKLERSDSYKIIAMALEKYPFNKKDLLVLLNHGDLLEKYYSKTTLFPLNPSRMSTNGNEIFCKILGDDYLNLVTRNNARSILKEYIGSTVIPPIFENYLKKEIINKLEKNRYISVVLARVYIQHGYYDLIDIAKSDNLYQKQDLSLMLLEKINYNILEICYKNLEPVSAKNYGPWEIHIFKKP